VARSTQVTFVGNWWWKNANTFEPTRIGTCPSPPVPWLIGGSGFGKVSVSPSPSRAPLFAEALSAPLPAGLVVQPGAVWRLPAVSVCGPARAPTPEGSGSARSSSPVIPSGTPLTPMPHWP
jgi:hypothetical protein